MSARRTNVARRRGHVKNKNQRNSFEVLGYNVEVRQAEVAGIFSHFSTCFRLTRILDQLTPNILSAVHKHDPETAIGISSGTWILKISKHRSIVNFLGSLINEIEPTMNFVFFLTVWCFVILIEQ